MQLSDFDYQLPEELIAQQPLRERSSSRLLLVDPRDGRVEDRQFTGIVDLVEPGDLLVFNDTRVIPARLFGEKQTGGRIEVMVERVLDDRTLLAHLRASKSPRAGTTLKLEGEIECVMRERRGDLFVLEQQGGVWLELLERYGRVPLPPYIRRADETADRDRYQTVYASKPGAVAAPTAGLHFDDEILARLREKGARSAHVTLHVGAGTFQPMRGEDIDSHVMHSELIEVPPAVCDQIAATRERGNRVIAIGTTVVRCLESAVRNGKLRSLRGESNLFIKPGYDFHVVDAMLTNFHLPRSTLLILVSAFAGTALMREAYRHAVAGRYRFFSYGDAMFIASRSRRAG
ncbi:MAG: tRNA preQ1(34) S-adenosylmethionine ribosyltransferase-isomerase QueA [Gammaproteobacteria bacterium]|jgi:S-adenosylmethionine:tRNA ribosyltransferase-isomerase